VKNILVTGGAGFIGSHLIDRLVDRGHYVRVLDNLVSQVHGPQGELPPYFNPKAEFVKGDVRNREVVLEALNGMDAVFHLAATVGVGQSMYEIQRYVEVNSLGGAVLLDVLANENHNIRKAIVASSMSIYGEGKYNCTICGPVYPKLRSDEALSEGQWEMRCPNCSTVVEPCPTDEDKPLLPTSIYAISKRDHEEMFLSVGRAYEIPTVALRFFNVYGPRQALSNPYTGVAAIFSSRLLNNRPPVIFEDGMQSRDFVHVGDVVQACILAMESREADYEVFNVGTGRPVTVRQVAEALIEKLRPNREVVPEITGQFRQGDIRHCYADIGKIQDHLGYRPQVQFEEGVSELAQWVASQSAYDGFDDAQRELRDRRLVE
jgi:dTDP-L-rhamnose 4-epimerase